MTSVWIGPNALTAYRRDDSAHPTVVDGAFFGRIKSQSDSITLPQKRLIPVRSFFAQGGGPWAFNYKIVFTPSDGSAPVTVVSNSGLAAGRVFSQSCDGQTAPELSF